jgi:UDP-2,4-diacetamido-2,4,6-trideoxy-beta-L-altropyranose hydrolase
MNIVFRVDASLDIGSGHVMRCLTLAKTLSELGANTSFICREHPGNLLELIRDRGFNSAALLLPDAESCEFLSEGGYALTHDSWLGTDWRSDAEQSQAAITDEKIDWLIVDHYALDARWESAMRPFCERIMVIDDLADRDHDCDLLLDQNLVAGLDNRYDGKIPRYCGRLLGPDYALLHPDYRELHFRVPPREGLVKRVLVYFGSDIDNLTGMAIAAIESQGLKNILVDIIVNSSSPHLSSIRRKLEGKSRFRIFSGLTSLAPLMVQADLAIGAGGATSWERCCLGLPTVVITLAENQKPSAAELDRRGLIHWLGHKHEVSETRLASHVKQLLDSELPSDWSKQCWKVVDGRGAEQVANILMLNSETNLRARPADLRDEALLLRWANDSQTQENSFSPAPIDPANYRTFFHEQLRNIEGCQLYILETEDGMPIGQVRFTRLGVEWEIYYSIDPKVRGRRLEKPALETAMLALRATINEGLVFGCVKKVNRASRQVFEELGFISKHKRDAKLSIGICSGLDNWINTSIPGLLLNWLAEGHDVTWAHSAEDLSGGDLCFYLGYEKIVHSSIRARYRNNLAVHASNLPKGRGWSPASWLILEGANQIPVTLFAAVDQADEGPIYSQKWLDLDGAELVDDWRKLLAIATVNLSREFVAQYPSILESAIDQIGDASAYPRRVAEDSELNPNKTMAEQFNLMRVVDNQRYPAFFYYKEEKFMLKISTCPN